MKKVDQLILFIGILLIILGVQYVEHSNIIPSPETPVVVPDVIPPSPKVPDLVTNIIYDDCEQALKLSEIYNKPLVLIFGASWCPYCKDLKKDISTIKSFNKTIVCLLDVEKNKKLVEKYKIIGLPTSVIIKQNKEYGRKSGYRNHDYEMWLNGNL